MAKPSSIRAFHMIWMGLVTIAFLSVPFPTSDDEFEEDAATRAEVTQATETTTTLSIFISKEDYDYDDDLGISVNKQQYYNDESSDNEITSTQKSFLDSDSYEDIFSPDTPENEDLWPKLPITDYDFTNVRDNFSDNDDEFELSPKDPKQKIDEFIRNVYLPSGSSQGGSPGLGLAVVRNHDEIYFTTGYGYSNAETGHYNGNNTQFLIASITKSFTAVVVVKVLSEEFPELGESVLDIPIRKLVPQFNLTLSDRFRSEQATFRDLLGHRMCLQRDDLPSVVNSYATIEELVYRQRYAKEICGMRSEFQYSNPMFVIASQIVSLLANRTYGQLVEELLVEIGMSNSTFAPFPDNWTGSGMPFRARPYYRITDWFSDNERRPMNTNIIQVSNFNAAMGLWTTPNDMAKYMIFQMNLGKVDGRQVVPEKVMRWLRKPSIHIQEWGLNIGSVSSPHLLPDTVTAYGLGLMIGSYDGWECIQHSGFVFPYTSLMSIFPSLGIAVFSSTNESPSPSLNQKMVLHAFIADLLRGSETVEERDYIIEHRSYDGGVAKLQTKMANPHSPPPRRGSLLDYDYDYDRRSDYEETLSKRADDAIIGVYGNGYEGEVEIAKKWNALKGKWGLYLTFGWAGGWLERSIDPYGIYNLLWDGDIADFISANLGTRMSEDPTEVFISQNGTLKIYYALFWGSDPEIFQRGVYLNTLPPTPWSSSSCGNESRTDRSFWK